MKPLENFDHVYICKGANRCEFTLDEYEEISIVQITSCDDCCLKDWDKHGAKKNGG